MMLIFLLFLPWYPHAVVLSLAPISHRHRKSWVRRSGRPASSNPWGTTRTSVSLDSRSRSNDEEWTAHHTTQNEQQNRRCFLEGGALSLASLGAFGSASDANARGLVRFPCTDPLLNTYHFMRAGSSLLEVEDIWSTNPLFLTNREAALSEVGEEQVREACRYLKATGSTPTVVRYSLAAACIDSANIVGEELRVGRDRLVPEFNYADPRAIGAWDYSALNATEEAVWALDADEAGPYGKGGKPPPNEDGTPAETLSDQVVRLTNLMSVLETLYSGDTVLVVFPDGTGPALLSCLIAGIPLNRVHELQFCPGEIRCNVDYESINALASQPPSPVYLNILQRGRAELKQLRDNPDFLRNVKDLKYEEEREQEKMQEEAKRQEEAKALELERQKQREERLKIEQERKEAEAKRKEEARVKELERQRKREEMLQRKSNEPQNSVDVGTIAIAVVTAVGGTAIVASSLGGDGVEEVTNERENIADISNGTAISLDGVHSNATDIDTDMETPLNASTSEIESKSDVRGDENGTSIGTDTSALNETRPAIESEADDTILLDERPEEQMKLIDSLPNVIPDLMPDESAEGGQKQPEDIDYDEAWLGAIADIMNEDSESGSTK